MELKFWIITQSYSQKTFFAIILHQHGRRDVRCNLFLIVNPIVLSMTFSTYNIPQTLGEKWIQIKGNLKKKNKRKKIRSIICINYNLKRKKKHKTKTQKIILNKYNLARFCFVCVCVCSAEVLFSEIKSCKVYFFLKFQAKKNIFELKQETLLLARIY